MKVFFKRLKKEVEKTGWIKSNCEEVEKKGWKKKVEKKRLKKEVEKRGLKKQVEKRGWKKRLKKEVEKRGWKKRLKKEVEKRSWKKRLGNEFENRLKEKKTIDSCWIANWLLVSKVLQKKTKLKFEVIMKIKRKHEWSWNRTSVNVCPNLFHHELLTIIKQTWNTKTTQRHVIWSFDRSRMMITKWTENLSLLLCHAWFNSREAFWLSRNNQLKKWSKSECSWSRYEITLDPN